MIFFKNYKNCFDYIHKKIKKRNNIIISGGTTIKSLLQNCNKIKNFYHNKVLLSDERLLIKKSKMRNDFFFKNLIKKNFIKQRNFIHYKQSYLCNKNLDQLNNIIKKINFQFAILGLGVNNHIASIFENSNKITINKSYYYINNSPKKPKERVTISIKKLNKVKKIFLIVNKKKRNKELKKMRSSEIFKLLKKNLEILIIK